MTRRRAAGNGLAICDPLRGDASHQTPTRQSSATRRSTTVFAQRDVPFHWACTTTPIQRLLPARDKEATGNPALLPQRARHDARLLPRGATCVRPEPPDLWCRQRPAPVAPRRPGCYAPHRRAPDAATRPTQLDHKVQKPGQSSARHRSKRHQGVSVRSGTNQTMDSPDHRLAPAHEMTPTDAMRDGKSARQRSPSKTALGPLR